MTDDKVKEFENYIKECVEHYSSMNADCATDVRAMAWDVWTKFRKLYVPQQPEFKRDPMKSSQDNQEAHTEWLREQKRKLNVPQTKDLKDV